MGLAASLPEESAYAPFQALGLGYTEELVRSYKERDLDFGIDLPTMNNKDERMIAAAQIDKYLPLPFERTAVNGFGFVQIIRRRERANLMELLREDPVLTAALALLRRAEQHGTGGAATITAAPAIIDLLHKRADWIEQLARRRGGEVTLRADSALSLAAGHVA